MKHIKWASRKHLSKKLRTQFVTGILVVVPIGAAILTIGAGRDSMLFYSMR